MHHGSPIRKALSEQQGGRQDAGHTVLSGSPMLASERCCCCELFTEDHFIESAPPCGSSINAGLWRGWGSNEEITRSAYFDGALFACDDPADNRGLAVAVMLQIAQQSFRLIGGKSHQQSTRSLRIKDKLRDLICDFLGNLHVTAVIFAIPLPATRDHPFTA